MSVVFVADSHAQCDSADFLNFEVRPRSGTAAISPTEIDFAEGGANVTIPLSAGVGDAGLMPRDSGFDTSTRVVLNSWLWRLIADTRGWLSPNDLRVSYQISNGDQLISSQDPSSRADAVVLERNLSVNRFGQRRTRFRGFLDLQIDYSTATRAGAYVGTLTVTVECN